MTPSAGSSPVQEYSQVLIRPATLVGVPRVRLVTLLPFAQTSNSAPVSVMVFSLIPTPFGSLNTTRIFPEVVP